MCIGFVLGLLDTLQVCRLVAATSSSQLPQLCSVSALTLGARLLFVSMSLLSSLEVAIAGGAETAETARAQQLARANIRRYADPELDAADPRVLQAHVLRKVQKSRPRADDHMRPSPPSSRSRTSC